MDPQLLQRAQAVLEETYAAGVRAGGDAMRDAILKAAGAPTTTKPAAATRRNGTDRSGTRAPRGLLRAVIVEVLAQSPGMTEQEIEEAAHARDPRVVPRSVGGELRRLRGNLYRKDGSRWSLMAKDAAGSQEVHDPA